MSQEPFAKRLKLSGDDGASSAAAPPATGVLPDDPKSWTIDHVYQWAVEIVNVDPEDAQKLKGQKITGKSLHLMTEERLERYGIPGGPAAILSEAVVKLFPSTAKPSARISGGDLPLIHCIISNPNDPTKHFLAEVVLDSACAVPMILSQRKLEQLGIKRFTSAPSQEVTGLGNATQTIFPYDPVTITIPLGQPTTNLTEEDIMNLPAPQKKVGGIMPWAYWTRLDLPAGSPLPEPTPTPSVPAKKNFTNQDGPRP